MDADVDRSGAAAAERDERYNRQVYAWGRGAEARRGQAAIAAAKVLILGLRGTGVETAKNLILMGLSVVHLFDPAPVSAEELAGNFAADEASVGKRRAEVAAAALAELNRATDVRERDFAGWDELLDATRAYDAVVGTDLEEKDAVALDARCRAHGVKFVLAESRGLFSRIFVDVGPRHWVSDTDGEQPPEWLIMSCWSEDARGAAGAEAGAGAGAGAAAAASAAAAAATTATTGPGPKRVCAVLSGSCSLRAGAKARFRQTQGPGNAVLHEQTWRVVGWSDTILTLEAAAGDDADAAAAAAGSRTDADEEVRTSGGFLVGVKEGMLVEHSPLESLVTCDRGTFERSNMDVDLTAGKCDRSWIAHRLFHEKHAAAAPEASEEDARVPHVRRRLHRGWNGHVAPFCAVVGGVAAQEVVKCVSGLFAPLSQWMYLDASECMEEDDDDESKGESESESAGAAAPAPAPVPARTRGQEVCLGRDVQRRLSEMRLFVVGAGAIGCEALKNLALMGVACGAGGEMHVTDMDRIERSNLSRQFLFRDEHVGRPKSVTAAAAASRMGPAGLRIVAHEGKVGGGAETEFTPAFWSSLSAVVTALDNVEARMFVDGECVKHHLPLLESGTLGTKGHTQMVVPGLTESYGSVRDAPDESIAVCTLKNFPYKVEHTLQWATDWFEGAMRRFPTAANAFVDNDHFVDEARRNQTEGWVVVDEVARLLGAERAFTTEDCARWAAQTFDVLFNQLPAQILHAFPPDATTSGGQPFWGLNGRRCPTPVRLDPTDPLHREFLVAAAWLRGLVFNLHPSAADEPAVLRVAAAAAADGRSAGDARMAAAMLQTLTGAVGGRIAADDAELKHMQQSPGAAAAGGGGGGGGEGGGDERWEDVLRRLPTRASVGGLRLQPQHFDKDEPLHMRLVAAVGNLRARVYRIDEVDTTEARRIAGRIIPAIATTTSVVSGLIALELFKVCRWQQRRERGAAGSDAEQIELFRSSNVNLAVPKLILFEPTPCARTRVVLPAGARYVPHGATGAAADTTQAREWSWTLWDSVEVRGPLTMSQFVQWAEETFGAPVSMINADSAILFSAFAFSKAAAAKRDARASMLVPDVACDVRQAPLPRGTTSLGLTLVLDGGPDPLPVVHYLLGPEEAARHA